MGSSSGLLGPSEVPASGVSPLAAGPRPPADARLFIYNSYSACFQESSRHLLKSCFPKLGCAPGRLGLQAHGHFPGARKFPRLSRAPRAHGSKGSLSRPPC